MNKVSSRFLLCDMIITRNFFVTRSKRPMTIVLSTTTPDNCMKTLDDHLLSLLSSIHVLSVSYLLVCYFCDDILMTYFLSMTQLSKLSPGRMKGFEKCFKVQDQGSWRRQNLHAAILRATPKRIQIKLYERRLEKET